MSNPTPARSEMAPVGELELCFDLFAGAGDAASSEPVLLVSGLGSQMIAHDAEFCGLIAAHGHDVVRFDNRDVGQSTHLEEPVDIAACMTAVRAGEEVPAPYDLSAMAADAIGLMDHLGMAKAHIAGSSMGGMIVQTMAIEYPERIASMTSIMSTTGERKVGQPTDEAAAVLLAPPAATLEGAIENAHLAGNTWGSPDVWDPEARTRLVTEAYGRELDVRGTARQLAAIWKSGSRAEGLASLAVPTLVIHGDADTLVQPDGGVRTAELVPGARLEMVPGMGHDRPRHFWDTLTGLIAEHAAASPAVPG